MSAQYTLGSNQHFYSFDYCISMSGDYIKMGFMSHPEGQIESGVFPMKVALEAAAQSVGLALLALKARGVSFDEQKEWDWVADTYLSDLAESIDVWRAMGLRKQGKLN